MEITIPACQEDFDAMVEYFRSSENLMPVQAVYKVVDALSELSQQQHDSRFACSAGCAHCCHQLVWPSEVEWVVIEDRLRKDNDLFNQLRDRMWQNLQEWRSYSQSVPSERLDNKSQVASDWAGQPCMFLDRATQTCTVHNERPMGCRVTVSATKCASFALMRQGLINEQWVNWALAYIIKLKQPARLSPLQVWAISRLKDRL